jgi:hypothetical protein
VTKRRRLKKVKMNVEQPCQPLKELVNLTEPLLNPVSEVVAVADAMKSRVITKGPLEHNLLRPLQQKLHSTMKKLPAFQLIGKWVECSDLAFCKEKKENEIINCADYSAATDGMYSSLSEAFLTTLFDISPTPETDLGQWIEKSAIPSITGNTLRYNIDGEKSDIPQRRGQMMGSLLSFPILNAINAACWLLHRYDFEGRKESYKKLATRYLRDSNTPLRTNGDDLLAANTRSS